MNKIKLFFIPLLIAALFAACTDNENAPVNVQSIVFKNITNDTLIMSAGESFKFEVETTPPNSPYNFYLTTGLHFGQRSLTLDVPDRTLFANCGGSGQVIAVAPNGEGGYSQAVCTVIVNESVLGVGNPNKNLYFLYNRNGSYTGTVSILDLADLQPLTANLKSRSITNSNSSNFTFSSTAYTLRYNTASTATNQSTSAATTVTVSVTNGDDSVVSGNLYFKNASHLHIMTCCFAYQTYGYYHGGLFSSKMSMENESQTNNNFSGGWHSNETTGSGVHTGLPAGHPHYILVDFKEAYTMKGCEFWRDNGDTRDLEVYYIAPPATLPTSTYAGTSANSGGGFTMNATGFAAVSTNMAATGFIKWGDCTFGDDSAIRKTVINGPTITTRYLLVKLASGNRGNSYSLKEIYPYIVID